MDTFLSSELSSYLLGQVVLSRKGKDQGRYYVVVGLPEKGRVALADAEKFNVSKPKKKNPRHIQSTALRAVDLVNLIEAGRDIDRGRFCQILAGLQRDALEKKNRVGEAG